MSGEFADDNLALAILQAMVDAGIVAEAEIEAIKSTPYDRRLYWDEIMEDAADDGTEFEDDAHRAEYFEETCARRFLNGDALHKLTSLMEKHAARLGELKSLRWSVPADVMFVCFPAWDGESDEFDLESLQGIEACSALEEVSFDLFAKPVDLSPLTRLPLTKFVARGVKPGQQWSALLQIPSLRTVRAPVDEATAQALTQRGVTVAAK